MPDSGKPIFVVAGVGNGSGTGVSSARLFAQNGYRVALIARRIDSLKKAADSILEEGGEAVSFPIKAYTKEDIHDVFEDIKKHWPGVEIRICLWNAGHRITKPFLELTDHDITQSIQVNILGAFQFSKEAILAFKDLEINEVGARGVLIHTSATSAWRGNTTTAAFAAGKHGLRGLSQSLNKEFGRQNIHVAHCIVDGTIKTDITTRIWGNPEWEKNENLRLNPASVAKTYLWLTQQDKSAWTWELDLRPAHEHW